MGNNVTKPATMLMEQFASSLAKLVTESGLPPYLIEYILRDLCSEVHALALKYAREEKTAYEKAAADAKKNEKTDEGAAEGK